jgi:TRAP-type C4-dicarboxylate transport system permease small subunit
MKIWLDKLESRGINAARFCALIGMLGLVALTLMTNLDVSMRWLFDRPLDGVSDVAPLIVAIVVASFFPFSIAGRHHISICFLGTMLGKRVRAWLEAAAAFVSLAFFAVLAWQFIVYTIDLNEVGQTTWAVQIPVAPFWTVVCIFMVVSVAVQLNLVLTRFEHAWNWSDTGENGSVSRNRFTALSDGP